MKFLKLFIFNMTSFPFISIVLAGLIFSFQGLGLLVGMAFGHNNFPPGALKVLRETIQA